MPYCATCGAKGGPVANFCAACGMPAERLLARPPPGTRRRRDPASFLAGVLALLLNGFVLPGVGSLVARKRVGWIQTPSFLLLIAGAIFAETFAFVVLLLVGAFAIWIWGLATAVQIMRS